MVSLPDISQITIPQFRYVPGVGHVADDPLKADAVVLQAIQMAKIPDYQYKINDASHQLCDIAPLVALQLSPHLGTSILTPQEWFAYIAHLDNTSPEQADRYRRSLASEVLNAVYIPEKADGRFLLCPTYVEHGGDRCFDWGFVTTDAGNDIYIADEADLRRKLKVPASVVVDYDAASPGACAVRAVIGMIDCAETSLNMIYEIGNYGMTGCGATMREVIKTQAQYARYAARQSRGDNLTQEGSE